MFNLFKTKEKEPEQKQVVEKPQEQKQVIDSKFIQGKIDESIHDLLEKHQIHLTKDGEIERLENKIKQLKEDNKGVYDKIQDLSSLGFMMTPSNTKIMEDLKEREKAIKLEINIIEEQKREAINHMKIKDEYFMKYPGYKFVDTNTMRNVMREYDLFLADNCFYSKEVPQEAIDIMKNFMSEIRLSQKTMNVISQYGHLSIEEKPVPRNYLTSDMDAGVYHMSSGFRYRPRAYFGDIAREEYSRRKLLFQYTTSKLKMIAPEDHFTIPTATLTDYNRSTTGKLFNFNSLTRELDLNTRLGQEHSKKVREVLDPIACLEVEGGYIVLHAWDKEAEIPEIKNVNLN